MRHVSALLALFLFSFSLTWAQAVNQTAAAQAERVPVDENSSLIQSALESSHATALQLSPKDEVELLTRAAQMMGKQNPQAGKEWFLEAFRVAQAMTSGSQKARYEVDIIRHWARVDSAGALSLLPALELPASWNDCEGRKAAPAAVFSEFLKQHPGDWSSLAGAAQQLGDSGNYPFHAMQAVIQQVAKEHPDDAAALVNQAIHYYAVGARDSCSSNQLAALLAQHSKLVPGSTLKAALGTLLASLDDRDGSTANDSPSYATPQERQKMLALDQATLGLLTALLKSLDRGRADEFSQKHPSLLAAGSAVADPEVGTNTVHFESGQDQMEISVLSSSPVQGQLQGAADEKQTGPVLVTNTEAPLALPASQLQLEGGSMHVVQVNSQAEEEAFLNASAQVSAHDDERLIVLLERALLLAHDKRIEELANTIGEAFAIGDQLFRKSVDDSPLASWNDRPGAQTVSSLVEAVAKSAPRLVLDKIKEIHNSVLQGQLYVSFAQAIESQQDSGLVLVSCAEE